MFTSSFWKQVTLPRFDLMRSDVDVEVAIVGGGMTGITAAYLLQKSGRSVVLLERDQCAQQDTGNTTAHLTHVTDIRPRELIRRFGLNHAQAIWDAGAAAMQQIAGIVDEERIACELQSVPGYLHQGLLSERDERDELREDCEAARAMEFDADFLERVPLVELPGVRFPDQAIFHPLLYLRALLDCTVSRGGLVYEQTEAREFEYSKSHRIRIGCGDHSVHCDFVIIATDVPLTGLSSLAAATLLQTRIAPYTSYVIGAKLPRGAPPQACFWDTSDPYYFLRLANRQDGDYAIFGGCDHKTGQADDTRDRFVSLHETLQRILPSATPDARWSGQVIESHDGLPLIGETAERQFIATGFSGNGITFGTLAAMMACDALAGRRNPWRDLFSPARPPLRGVLNYLRENLDYPYYMVKDRISREQTSTIETLPVGRGAIMRLNGRRTAVYRDHDGHLIKLSPVCTHLGCLVRWNEAESTWDCPCHGSRFRASGEVMAGPAERALERFDGA